MGARTLRKLTTFLFDLDGCIYYTDVLADGAKELLAELRINGVRICFITNNSRQTAAEVAAKLNKMGLVVSADEVMTATEYVGLFLLEERGVCTVKAVGSEGLHKSLERVGHRVLPLEHPEIADVVVIGRDTEFTFAKLQQIADEVGRGATIIAANPDGSHPGGRGERVPETGALVAAIEAVIEQTIPSVGKPAPHMFQFIMKQYGLTPNECVMIGDNPRTDIAGGIQAGMHTIWIRGEQSIEALAGLNLPMPDYIVKDIAELLKLYR